MTELGVQTDVLKGIMFLASFLLVFYLIVSVIRTRELVDLLVKVLVAGGAILAVFAIVESRTGFNAFEHLGAVVPFLQDSQVRTGEVLAGGQSSRLRLGPEPDLLGAAFALLIPLAVYLTWRTKTWLWACAGVLLVLGVLAPVTRTSVVMLVPVILVFLWLRPTETRRLCRSSCRSSAPPTSPCRGRLGR